MSSKLINVVNKILLDSVIAYGHPNVLGTNRVTIEVTTEDFLTKRGDCIIAVRGSKAIKDVSPQLKTAIQAGKKISVVLRAGAIEDMFEGVGHKDLSCSNNVSFVFRKSNFISDRTILLGCDKGSSDLSREMMLYLRDPAKTIEVLFYCDKQ